MADCAESETCLCSLFRIWLPGDLEASFPGRPGGLDATNILVPYTMGEIGEQIDPKYQHLPWLSI